MTLLLLALACNGKSDPADTGLLDTGEPAVQDSDTASTDTSGEDSADSGETGADTGGDTDTGSEPGVPEDLADADFIAYGAAGYDAARVVRSADMDLDGVDDLVSATLGRDAFRGGASVLQHIPLGTYAMDDVGVALTHTVDFDGAGRSVGTGDFSGDLYPDVQVGTPWISDAAVIAFGPFADASSLADASMRMWGRDNSYCGHGSDLADVSGDGVADALVGCYVDTSGANWSGTVYIVYGPRADADIYLPTDADGALQGEQVNDGVGRFMKGGGDLDGDGIGDLTAPAPWSSRAGMSSGMVYVVYGPVVGDLSLADADGLVQGTDYNMQVGVSVDMADVTGDGLSDLVIGSFASLTDTFAGAAAIIAGPAAGTRAFADETDLILGDHPMIQAGEGVASKDMDGDGYAEVVVGAPQAGDASGSVGLFPGPVEGHVNFGDAALTWRGTGVAGTGLALGDFDGDGRGDLAVGAPYYIVGADWDCGGVFVELGVW